MSHRLLRNAAVVLMLMLAVLAPHVVDAQGNCSIFRSWNTGDSLSAGDLSASFTTVGVTNDTFACLSDYSATESQMQTTTDPYPSSAASLATTGQGELERLRYVIKKLTGWSQWYAHTEALTNLDRGAIWGLGLSNGTDATNDIDIAVGQATSSDGTGTLVLASALTKQLDAAWSVGSAAGGLDVGTIANGTYHIYLIKRTDTSIVDALFSRNPDRAATITVTIASPGVVTWADHGLQIGSSLTFTTTGALPTGLVAGTRYYVITAGFGTGSFQVSATEGGSAVNTSGTQSGVHTGTSSPVLPTSYTLKRRLGSIPRASATLLGFTQDGDEFLRKAPVLDVNTTDPGTSAVTSTLSVPVGIKVRAYVIAYLNDSTPSATTVWFSSLDQTDTAASHTNGTAHVSTGTASQQASTALFLRTSVAAQVRYRAEVSAAGVTVRISTQGWIDTRGR